jgi:RNA polymerase sigma factor (sigma-70 family)
MAALKLYFVLISEDNPAQISVHRDLLTLNTTWEQTDKANTVGLVHIGFIRPKLKSPSNLLKFKGQVLVSVAAKWALPDEYISSVAVVAEMSLSAQIVPLYQLIKGLGFDEAEPGASFQSSVAATGRSGHTIAEAALLVLNDAGRPLSKEEIFSEIIERELYQFGAKKPVSILAVELNRHVINTDYSKPAAEPLFAKFGADRFTSLASTSNELTGWVKQLAIDKPELASLAVSYGIYSEENHIEQATNLPNLLRDQIELQRFAILLPENDITDPISIIKIMPSSLTKMHVSSLTLPVRILNVFGVSNINYLNDLRYLKVEDMLKWPNFGRKSARDLCDNLLESVEKLSEQVDLIESIPSSEAHASENTPRDETAGEVYQTNLVSSLSLKEHFKKALSELTDIQRQVIECRTGYAGTVMTLEEVGKLVGVTRERIRQIQKKYVAKIISTEFWDDYIALKIGQLLIDRSEPLYLEMLEVEDPWFEGFMGNYQHLAAIIELFSENEIRVIKIDGATVVSRIKYDVWAECVSYFRKSLKDKVKEKVWTRHDIESVFKAVLSEKGSPELVPLMWGQFKGVLQFEDESDEAKLLSFGLSAESAVQTVLLQAECPLHYSEVAMRATELLGKTIDELRAQNALMNQGAMLYGRGIYGLEKFNPISPRMCNNIRLVVNNIMYDGPLMKQWHASEILSILQAKFSALPEELDIYILSIILRKSDRLVYLNRMVWGRSDSKQSVNDRVDMADAFTQILEKFGGPLKGTEIKERLADIRGVPKTLQLQSTERMIQVGPDFWGLVERDVGGTDAENTKKLDTLYYILNERQKGIHVSEVENFVEVSDESEDLPSAYALLNLAQRDDRLHLGRSMYLGLTEWDGDTRRLNTSQAVRELLATMVKPMTIAEIQARVEDLTEMPINGSVTGILINEGAVYDQRLRVWFKA